MLFGKWISRLMTIAGALACVFTMTGFLSAIWWPFDLTAHFRAQYAFFLLGLALCFLASRRFKTAGLFAAFGSVNVCLLLPFWISIRPQTPVPPERLKLLLINVRTENTRSDLVKSFIQQKNPDLILLEETDDRWLSALRDLENQYPYVVSAPRDDNFGIALYSRLPLTKEGVVTLGSERVPSVTAEFQFGGTNIVFLGTHPVPPRGAIGHWYRDDQLKAVGEFLERKKAPVILLGDLNVTPWSARFRGLEKTASLQNTAKGFGPQASWPTYFLPLRIPIDHCLVSPSLMAVHREIGPDIGSDHFPIFVELAIHLPEM